MLIWNADCTSWSSLGNHQSSNTIQNIQELHICYCIECRPIHLSTWFVAILFIIFILSYYRVNNQVTIHYKLIVVDYLLSINVPVAVNQGVTALSNENIYTLGQRIIQMTQAFGNAQLTNGNGTNFWDQMVATAVLVASMSRVCIHINVNIILKY